MALRNRELHARNDDDDAPTNLFKKYFYKTTSSLTDRAYCNLMLDVSNIYTLAFDKEPIQNHTTE